MIDLVSSSSCVFEKRELFLILMALFYFYLFGGVFTKHSKTVSYIVFLMLFIGILHLIKIILNKIQFVQFTSPNITILLCLQITNIDCKKY